MLPVNSVQHSEPNGPTEIRRLESIFDFLDLGS
jgi:hypothetical protein